MASNSSSGTSSSGGSAMQKSGSEGDLVVVGVDQRKRKRMISNRESARRSRLRKQKHLDDLRAQAAELREENQRIAAHMNVVKQHFLAVAANNSILRVQAAELGQRLQSLNEIIGFVSANNAAFGSEGPGEGWFDPVSLASMNQPILASADMFEY